MRTETPTRSKTDWRRLTCTRCTCPLPAQLCNTGEWGNCPSCASSLKVEAFPALFRRHQSSALTQPTLAGEASCFYHSDQAAVESCARCGRFVCGLCDLPISGEHICPGCLESGKKSGKLVTLQNRRVLYDSGALALSLLPLLFWPVTVLTAPATIFMVLYYWKKPGSLIPRTRIRFILAFVFALLEIAAWVLFIISVFN